MTNEVHAYYIQQAVTIAQEGMRKNKGGPFGAVIVKNDKIIGAGCNQVTSSNDPTAHAEVVAIRQAANALSNFSLQGSVLYTTCEPCPMCLSAIYWARIDAVYYADSRADAARGGFDDEWIYKEVSLPIEKRFLPMRHIADESALALFDEWQDKQDKIAY